MRKSKLLFRVVVGVALLGVVAGVWQIAQSRLAETPPEGSCFRVAEENGAWSLKDPHGRPFFSIGINNLTALDVGDAPGAKYDGLSEHHGNVDKWKAQTLQRMNDWNVNSIGAWSSLRGRPYVVELSLSYGWVDVFDDSFEPYVKEAAMKALGRLDVGATYRALDRDPLLIGYFTDNELVWGWGYGWAEGEDKEEKEDLSMFEYYATLEPDSGGKQVWASYLANTYELDWNKFLEVWTVDVQSLQDLARATRIAPRSPEYFMEAVRVGDAFTRHYAERYFEVTSRVMRGHLPHHLNLGVRLTHDFPDVVAEVEGRYVDVASFNMYSRDLDYFRRELTRLHNASGRPVLITEFAFPARENRSGNKNAGYEEAEVRDDAERGAYYARFVQMCGELPFVVGLHWFQYQDQPTIGRRNDESVNFGFVDLKNRIYEDLARAAAEANGRILKRREGAQTDSTPILGR